eukprot:m.159095 g.159095  ORF g.159095 m.159095 type:complete len:885 (+) comp16482_c0_seq1:174-2828(+)
MSQTHSEQTTSIKAKQLCLYATRLTKYSTDRAYQVPTPVVTRSLLMQLRGLPSSMNLTTQTSSCARAAKMACIQIDPKLMERPECCRSLAVFILMSILLFSSAEQWTSHDGTVYDLSRLTNLEMTMRVPSIKGAKFVFDSSGRINCGQDQLAVACIQVPGLSPTSAGTASQRQVEQTSSARLTISYDGGQYCDVTRKPRKTVADMTCGAYDPSRATVSEGKGSRVCIYTVHFQHPVACPISSELQLHGISGCGVGQKSSSVTNCQSTDMITLHGVGFAPDLSYDVIVDKQACSSVSRLTEWNLECVLPSSLSGLDLDLELKVSGPDMNKVLRLSKAVSFKADLKAQFDGFEALGVGGLDKEVKEIYRRVFQSRSLPQEDLQALGVSHTKGILLHGPPGSGKTLIAKTVAKLLGTDKVTLINTPSIMQKYLGESEKQLSGYFEPARRDFEQRGSRADVHILIFDEIDAIFRERGNGDGSAASVAYDSVVNSLLTLMDGLKEQDNIVVFGMTNRPKLIDRALLRPGRFEVQIEIGLPDFSGRVSIFNIHTRSMRAAKLLHDEVDLQALASATRRFSGAEIAGVIRNAASLAIARHHDVGNGAARIQVLHADMLAAVEQMSSTHATSLDSLQQQYLPLGWRSPHSKTTETLNQLLSDAQALIDSASPQDVLSILITGLPGVGKTSLVLHALSQLNFEYVSVVSPVNYIGVPDGERLFRLRHMFEDAYKSSSAVIVLDNLDGLVDYMQVGNQVLFSHPLANAIKSLLMNKPPPSCRLLVLATTDQQTASTSILADVFTKRLKVFNLDKTAALNLLADTLDSLEASPVLPNDYEISMRSFLRVQSHLAQSSRLTSALVEEALLAAEAETTSGSSVWMYSANKTDTARVV